VPPQRALCSALLVSLLACGAEDPPAPAPPSTLRYVALGDSTGFGVGGDPPVGDGGYPRRVAERLRARGLAVELTNLSVPTARAADLADVQLPIAQALRDVGLVTVCIGANDVGGPRTPEEFGAELDGILAALVRLGAPVVACNVPDLSLTPDRAGEPPSYRERIVAMNAALAAAAARHGVRVVDLFTATAQLRARPELVWIDGYHPSAAGYEVWADLMMPAVLAALGLPAQALALAG
jgi:lysophospholipase L1-like esterase